MIGMAASGSFAGCISERYADAMNAPFRITTVKTAEGVAVPLPSGLGVVEGTQLDLAPTPGGFQARMVEDLDERTRRWREMLAKLAALPPIPRDIREPIEFPERPGL